MPQPRVPADATTAVRTAVTPRNTARTPANRPRPAHPAAGTGPPAHAPSRPAAPPTAPPRRQPAPATDRGDTLTQKRVDQECRLFDRAAPSGTSNTADEPVDPGSHL